MGHTHYNTKLLQKQPLFNKKHFIHQETPIILDFGETVIWRNFFWRIVVLSLFGEMSLAISDPPEYGLGLVRAPHSLDLEGSLLSLGAFAPPGREITMGCTALGPDTPGRETLANVRVGPISLGF